MQFYRRLACLNTMLLVFHAGSLSLTIESSASCGTLSNPRFETSRVLSGSKSGGLGKCVGIAHLVRPQSPYSVCSQKIGTGQ
jgi:hypothetical protein